MYMTQQDIEDNIFKGVTKDDVVQKIREEKGFLKKVESDKVDREELEKMAERYEEQKIQERRRKSKKGQDEQRKSFMTQPVIEVVEEVLTEV